MKKSGLKDGMVVIYKDGSPRIVDGNRLLRPNGIRGYELTEYNENLIDGTTLSSLTINKVYSQISIQDLLKIKDFQDLNKYLVDKNPLWERKPTIDFESNPVIETYSGRIIRVTGSDSETSFAGVVLNSGSDFNIGDYCSEWAVDRIEKELENFKG